ncbi:hypothetical protein CAF53_02480 [Sphingobium sp. LB126]|uniref:hypothetical protein n=1 Tax=Sphingobium sp. LB126 TaxID=1983755 RepID=UPI000C20BA01|nr:hypothetical protein [Sphingobium sp. LB126]PJG47231.1 hypothetical protein CAF53_02480 [Sphingobium sp. LB126]
MTDIVTALLSLRRLARAATQDELDAARMEAADILDDAGWERSARAVLDVLGRPVSASNDQPKFS